MNTDADQMLTKKKKTASIVCLVAGVLVLVSLFLPWLKAAKPLDVSLSLLDYSACGKDYNDEGERVERCESMSNFKLADQLKKQYERFKELSSRMRAMGEGRDVPDVQEPGTSFAFFGMATLIVGLIGVLSLGAAGILGLKHKFIREPIAITTVALLALCLALVLGCIFVAVKPGDSESARYLGVSWPFFVFGAGVVGGIAGAQMLGKAHGPPEYDPYADPTALT
jgi:hypothetical protein